MTRKEYEKKKDQMVIDTFDLVDRIFLITEWWADFIGEKSGAYERARRPNKFKEWKLKQPLWKQAFIEILIINIDSISI